MLTFYNLRRYDSFMIMSQYIVYDYVPILQKKYIIYSITIIIIWGDKNEESRFKYDRARKI
jgi:hypothetical protein